MLKQRVITAVLLLAVFLSALLYPSPEPFCAVTLLLIGLAGWEWARLNGCSESVARLSGLVLGLVLLALWWGVGLGTSMPWLWQVLGPLWVALAAWMLWRGVAGWALVSRGWRLAGGWVFIGLAWWALVQARHMGVEMLLSMVLLVWVADIAAYFGGKAFGRRKLAPSISPGKTWAGVYSGGLGVCLLAAGWLWWGGAPETHLYGKLWAWGPWPALLMLLVLTGMSVAGDLVESLVKRSAGVKDASQLLPGHGGVLDRIDALLPVMPLAMLVVTW